MSGDEELAELLGQAPSGPDPGFRFDVQALMTQRVQRRAGRRRALRTIAVSLLIGLIFAAAQALGLTIEQAQPFLLVAGVLGLAYLLALLSIEGPRVLLARSANMLRARI